MAEQPVTPQRVRSILSTFLYDSEKQTTKTSPEKPVASSTTRKPAGKETPSPPSTNGKATEIVTNRRSFASFLKRVETFSPVTWFAKPPGLSPLICCRYGWENTEFDMLHCTACGVNLCTTLPSSDNKDYKKTSEALEKKLLTAHEKFCLLAINPCPESFLKVDLHDVDGLRADFLQRVDALRRCAKLLPHLDYSSLETWGFAQSHAAKFCSEEDLSEVDTPTQIIALAFTGWTLRSREVLVCSLCRRQMGLWNFVPAGNEGHDPSSGHQVDSAGDFAPPAKMRKIARQSDLNPVSSHHAWCPWTALRYPDEDMLSLPRRTSFSRSPSPSSCPSSPASQHSDLGGGEGTSPPGCGDRGRIRKQPAWVLGVRLVAPGLISESRRLVQRVVQSPIMEGVHCIRKVVKTWSSPEYQRKQASALTS